MIVLLKYNSYFKERFCLKVLERERISFIGTLMKYLCAVLSKEDEIPPLKLYLNT